MARNKHLSVDVLKQVKERLSSLGEYWDSYIADQTMYEHITKEKTEYTENILNNNVEKIKGYTEKNLHNIENTLKGALKE